jgi:hypothetical protein
MKVKHGRKSDKEQEHFKSSAKRTQYELLHYEEKPNLVEHDTNRPGGICDAIFKLPQKYHKRRYDTLEQYGSRYQRLSVLAALMLGACVAMFGIVPTNKAFTDTSMHGILWCMATYFMTAAAVLAELYGFGYNRCADVFEAQIFTQEMGRLAFDLPVYFTFCGFVLFIAGTTHFFIMEYRFGIEHDAFTFCSAFCYMMPPFVIVAVLKMNYSLTSAVAFTSALKKTKGFTYDDLRSLLEKYLKDVCEEDYLDAELEEFISFAQSCKVVGENHEERAGKIEGLRRRFVEQLWDEFYAKLAGEQGERAKHHADILARNLEIATPPEHARGETSDETVASRELYMKM